MNAEISRELSRTPLLVKSFDTQADFRRFPYCTKISVPSPTKTASEHFQFVEFGVFVSAFFLVFRHWTFCYWSLFWYLPSYHCCIKHFSSWKQNFCAVEGRPRPVPSSDCSFRLTFSPRFRVYKKTSSNQLLTLYLGTRELVSRAGAIDPIKGIIYIDPRVAETNQKVYCQLTLTFRWVERARGEWNSKATKL